MMMMKVHTVLTAPPRTIINIFLVTIPDKISGLVYLARQADMPSFTFLEAKLFNNIYNTTKCIIIIILIIVVYHSVIIIM